MKTVLITGAAGFIGSNLAEELLQLGHRVVGLDNLSQGDPLNLESLKAYSRFEFHEGDVRDLPTVQRHLDRCDAVYHLAAFKIPRYGNALDTLMVNVKGTKTVLQAAVKDKKWVIFASTSDVYGRNPDMPFSEDKDLWIGTSSVKRWAYASSKIYDEHLCHGFREEHGVPVVIVRFFGGYGPNQNLTWWGGPQSVFIGAALKDEVMEVHGDGCQSRSFTYVSDHVDGLVRCLDNPEAPGEIFNLGNTEEITIADLARLVWKLAGKGEPKLKLISYRTFGKYEDVRRRVPDLSHSRRILGFEPKVSLADGLTKTVAWQRERMEKITAAGR